jgi:DHA2 family multidrug resistance protein-like MFS transporter
VNTASASTPSTGVAPKRAGLVLSALILAAGVANMNLSIANVALPDIGKDLGASQIGLNLVAVGFSLGLSISVLYLGALGDRYGRKLMLMLGLFLGIPTALLAAFSNSVEMLTAARILGGVAAGMAYPTTLALITALWSGSGRTRAIALWSALGAALSAVSPVAAGALLLHSSWGYAFLIPIPLGVVALGLVIWLVPGKVNESDEPVDHAGGVLSAVFLGALVLAINFAALEGQLEVVAICAAVAVIGGVLFFWRQRRAAYPLFDLKYAKRRTFWVAALSGIIVFGSLMGAMFVGMQFLQNVLGYDTLSAGFAILPCVFAMVIAAPFSSRMVERWGSRITLLIGFAFCFLGFVSMLVLWDVHTPYVLVGTSYAFLGIGVGIAGTPASHALTDSVPVAKVGMASGTGDLQRDLGGAVMQSIMGAILGAGYSLAVAQALNNVPANIKPQITAQIHDELTKSFGSAVDLASKYPQYQAQIVEAARVSFLQGSNWAYLTGIIAMLIGAALVWFFFPKRDPELAMYREYGSEAPAEH